MPDLEDLKICFVAGTLGQGGAERQLFNIIKALRLVGNCPSVLCLTQGEFWEEKIRELGVPVKWVGQSPSRLVRLACIAKTVRHQRPDILQSQHFYTNLYVALTAQLLALPAIGAIQNDVFSEVKVFGKIAGSLSLYIPRLIAANSRRAIKNAVILKVPASRLCFLPNAVDCAAFRPANNKEDKTIQLLAVGRLVEQKRMDRFVSVVARLQSQSTVPIRGIIAGSGPQKDALQAQAQRLGLLPDRLEFRGLVSDMASLYQQADIMVLTSDWEGSPNVVLEAMASGLPVVATCVGGVPDIVLAGQTGYIADPKDEESIVKHLHTLANDTDLRHQMGKNARKFVEDNHSLEQLPIHLEKLYKVALARKTSVFNG